jgi:hypothetical protein
MLTASFSMILYILDNTSQGLSSIWSGIAISRSISEFLVQSEFAAEPKILIVNSDPKLYVNFFDRVRICLILPTICSLLLISSFEIGSDS